MANLLLIGWKTLYSSIIDINHVCVVIYTIILTLTCLYNHYIFACQISQWLIGNIININHDWCIHFFIIILHKSVCPIMVIKSYYIHMSKVHICWLKILLILFLINNTLFAQLIVKKKICNIHIQPIVTLYTWHFFGNSLNDMEFI